MDLLLHADDIHASYDQRRILKGVGLSVHRGEILGLIGTNGAGKTTLMGVLAGSLKHDQGRITLAGEKYAPDSIAEAQACGVGLIPQNFHIDPDLTITEAIFRGTFQSGRPHGELRGQAAKLIRDIGITLDPDAKVGTLIRAEQALVEVLRMVAEEAQLVIMDEAAASLPDHDVAVLHQVLRMLTRQGRAIIYITHRLDEVRSIAHRIAILRDGRVHKIVEASKTDVDELAFLLLQQELERIARPTGPAAGEEVLRISNLGVGENVRDVSFNVVKGEIFGLVGTHRSGVYQLTEALAGIHPCTSGTIHVKGNQVQIRGLQDARRLKIGYSPDTADTFASGTSIADGLYQGKAPGAASLQDEITHLRGVADVVHRMRINTTNIQGALTTLSGGDRQKVELARWISTDCDVLILSHPSRGIDIGAKEIVYKMLTQLSQTGVAIILLSSDLSEMVNWCHRIGVMRDGELVTIEANANTNEDVLVHHMLGVKFESGGREARRVKV
ncbi:sugar ABC transporter ATP-binding protein [Paenarthrobacter nicotinovorans]|uniref:Sugar ABC transporter ATP-binding protein n=1 Tax=Paenarthrobacter nicotinovorans TaxID=29320 RepID=A0ABV0GWJ9_PAENI|nr:sugar ABC transporter ATP-binding protein [Paenarthrobacter nicotinovorans]SCZ57878.1 ribose transport system ATP-binding protein [Arthrobacter sp. UNCCL28]